MANVATFESRALQSSATKTTPDENFIGFPWNGHAFNAALYAPPLTYRYVALAPTQLIRPTLLPAFLARAVAPRRAAPRRTALITAAVGRSATA
jgi:hypothetical protein